MKHYLTLISTVLGITLGAPVALAGSILVLPPSKSKIEVIGIPKKMVAKEVPAPEMIINADAKKSTVKTTKPVRINKQPPKIIPFIVEKPASETAPLNANLPVEAAPAMATPNIPVLKTRGSKLRPSSDLPPNR